MKSVLITGSEGFVGRHLWQELETNGYQVFGTTLTKSPNDGKHVFKCDITKNSDIDKLVDKLRPDMIVHLAAIASPSLSFKEPKLTFEVNTLGTLALMEAVRKIRSYKPRLLIIGTSEEHGYVSPDKMPVSEDTLFTPVSPYSVSKLAAYYLSQVYTRSYNMDIIYACSFNHTGPGQRLGFLASDVAFQIVEIEQGKKDNILLTGNLDTHRNISDVRDVVRAYRLLLEKGVSGERYNVCSGISTPVKNVVDILISFSVVNIERKIDPSRNRPSDMPLLVGSHKKLTQATGWEPSIPLEKTLEDLLNSFRKGM